MQHALNVRRFHSWWTNRWAFKQTWACVVLLPNWVEFGLPAPAVTQATSYCPPSTAVCGFNLSYFCKIELPVRRDFEAIEEDIKQLVQQRSDAQHTFYRRIFHISSIRLQSKIAARASLHHPICCLLHDFECELLLTTRASSSLPENCGANMKNATAW